jgi:hypothetical protein
VLQQLAALPVRTQDLLLQLPAKPLTELVVLAQTGL